MGNEAGAAGPGPSSIAGSRHAKQPSRPLAHLFSLGIYGDAGAASCTAGELASGLSTLASDHAGQAHGLKVSHWQVQINILQHKRGKPQQAVVAPPAAGWCTRRASEELPTALAPTHTACNKQLLQGFKAHRKAKRSEAKQLVLLFNAAGLPVLFALCRTGAR
jgi:hypothetical protein